ncbi:hypothetical protein ACOSP7_008680 [Xanthoceras sorbifolium]
MASTTNSSGKSNSSESLETGKIVGSVAPHHSNNSPAEKNGCGNNGNTGQNKKKYGRNCSTRVSCNPLDAILVKLRKNNSISSNGAEQSHQHNDSSPKIDPPENEAASSTNSDDACTVTKGQSKKIPDFSTSFEGLQDQEKCCLLSFAVFPENAVVKKRLLVYWWVAEGFLESSNGENTVEGIATRILDDFMAKRFIVPVNKKRRRVVNRFKMDPFSRSQVIMLAREKKFFNYDVSSEKLTSKYSGSDRACLINAEKLESENQEKIKSLFNVNRRLLDFTFDWFSKMRNVQVLCLGMWQSSVEHHHIEVENSEFLKGLRNMESLTFLSLQGISGIQELPNSISNLRNLRILDLRACFNLESLPKEIQSLKMLNHLDVSECYLLEHMPKELLWLSDLQVLKGFVITDIISHGNVCTLADLAGLKKLRKLSINVNSETFSIEEFSTTLFKFTELEKLNIAWGGGSKAKESVAGKKMEKQKSLLKKLIEKQKTKVERATETKLKKLEFQCFPHQKLPDWLIPENLKNLKKLYIRGGALNSLGKKNQEGAMKWEVEVLQLKYLSELKMNWRELKAMFPTLMYLEKFKCPKVTLCPCDGSGVWLKPSTD